MKVRRVLVGAAFCAATALWNSSVYSQSKDEKKPAGDKPAAVQPPAAKPAYKPSGDKPAAPAAAKPGDKPAADKGGGAGGAMSADMEAMMKAAMPGEFHAKLKVLDGKWDALVKSYMDPGSPTETKGTCERKWIMDGRFLQEDHIGDFMGTPFKGFAITGYDNVLKKYVSFWIDNMGTGFMNSTGSVDAAGKTFTFEGEFANPMTGKMCKTRMVHKIADDRKTTFEMYGPDPEGKEMKMMEITYTKK